MTVTVIHFKIPQRTNSITCVLVKYTQRSNPVPTGFPAAMVFHFYPVLPVSLPDFFLHIQGI
jgi:hypothetical protein